MRLTSAGMPSMNWRRRSHEGHPPALLPSSTSVFTPRPFRCHAVIILYDAHAYRWSRSQGVSESRPTAKAQPRVRLRLRRRLVEIHVPAHPPASKRPHKVNETPFQCGALYCCDARIRSSASLRRGHARLGDRRSTDAGEVRRRRSVAPKNDDRRAGGGDPLLPHADGSDPAGPRRGRGVTHDRRHRVARTL